MTVMQNVSHENFVSATPQQPELICHCIFFWHFLSYIALWTMVLVHFCVDWCSCNWDWAAAEEQETRFLASMKLICPLCKTARRGLGTVGRSLWLDRGDGTVAGQSGTVAGSWLDWSLEAGTGNLGLDNMFSEGQLSTNGRTAPQCLLFQQNFQAHK